MPLCVDCRQAVQSWARVSQVSSDAKALRSLSQASLYLRAGRRRPYVGVHPLFGERDQTAVGDVEIEERTCFRHRI
ncbi:hypothetical protein DPMN_054038 [Dreissena polymorpha]|uniref:Uncharacterized protein n=1 Tax=Dreissena polymorpha TaxID=45954 RepID=A0A9D4CPY3_DREPO|nr:hypothetical protein DPMN_054038 [Dreissena polymorpha]